MRRLLRSAGGTPTAGDLRTHPIPPIQEPFASSESVEHERLQAIPVWPAHAAPDGVAFVDGIQRYAVEGWFGLAPVVRGYVAAAVLVRTAGRLVTHTVECEEFLVVPLARLAGEQRSALESSGFRLYDVAEPSRPHPILDVQRAAGILERRRERAERRATERYLDAAGDAWLVVDGAITGLGDWYGRHPRLLGVVKSHQTQFVSDTDLQVVLGLPEGHRSSVFARGAGGRGRVYSWYLRLWSWEERDVLHGLVRLERPPTDAAVSEATAVSRWLLAERAPLPGTDGRWDRLLYPIQQVETLLRAQAGTW